MASFFQVILTAAASSLLLPTMCSASQAGDFMALANHTAIEGIVFSPGPNEYRFVATDGSGTELWLDKTPSAEDFKVKDQGDYYGATVFARGGLPLRYDPDFKRKSILRMPTAPVARAPVWPAAASVARSGPTWDELIRTYSTVGDYVKAKGHGSAGEALATLKARGFNVLETIGFVGQGDYTETKEGDLTFHRLENDNYSVSAKSSLGGSLPMKAIPKTTPLADLDNVNWQSEYATWYSAAVSSSGAQSTSAPVAKPYYEGLPEPKPGMSVKQYMSGVPDGESVLYDTGRNEEEKPIKLIFKKSGGVTTARRELEVESGLVAPGIVTYYDLAFVASVW